MRGLTRLLATTIGQKFLVGLSGFFLCLFLIVHLGGNLFMYIGPEAYDNYAEALHEQEWLVKLVEAILFLLFAAHILLAAVVSRENRAARSQPYDRKESKLPDGVFLFRPHNWMFVTGSIVLAFLILHLADFTLEIRFQLQEGETPFGKAIRVLTDPLSAFVYVAGSLVLGVHLAHGVFGAAQSLGINHPKYEKLILWGGIAFAVIMAVGFASFPLWALARPS